MTPSPSALLSVPLNVSGRLLNATTGYPLAGLTVQMFFLEPKAPMDTTPQAQTFLEVRFHRRMVCIRR